MIEYVPTQGELAAQGMAASSPVEDGRTVVVFEGDPVAVQSWCLQAVGHFASPDFRFVSFVPPDRVRGLCVIAHNFTLAGDAELIPVGMLGQFHRDVRKCLAWWLFNLIGLRRITVRIRASDRRLQDFARRLGLRHEGTQRDFYGPGEDCSLWGITHDETRLLLLREGDPAPASSNRQVH
ncbi:hypothetical protein J2X36_005291 [Methylobacterium sp. BE186]|uniref:GNAT family N-acetyltransferase n=1 Tax=Methylobacterium sp. BE186 TaxID=2817715 RepID=UPI00285D13B9|nr:hypothetical protein [Methylobacterium sp. BE186]MDR7040508.1 hypothetical protein [Methylobacterium sp. BE186]